MTKVRFFFPDSQDQVNPGFDFVAETHPVHRIRQRDDKYAHEVLRTTPYDGILLSKPIADGTRSRGSKYTSAQRHRLYRLGAHQFFRLPVPQKGEVRVMGDCGAFSYVNEPGPPYTVDEVIDFYDGLGVDAGMSVDHVILGYSGSEEDASADWLERQTLTLELAAEFRRLHRVRRCRFRPFGVAQGWSPSSMAYSVEQLQRIGYRDIALGGMVPMKSADILACLAAIDVIRRSDTSLHLLGVTRCEHIGTFGRYGVMSFDSTSPFRQSFKDDDDNYYTLEDNFTAIRVPQVDGNLALRRGIASGEIDQAEAMALERECLEALRRFDRGRASAKAALNAVLEYEAVFSPGASRAEAYKRTLAAAPWRSCRCGVCELVGIEVILFRGSERNKRRGFHNLAVFWERLHRRSRKATAKTEAATKAGHNRRVHG